MHQLYDQIFGSPTFFDLSRNKISAIWNIFLQNALPWTTYTKFMSLVVPIELLIVIKIEKSLQKWNWEITKNWSIYALVIFFLQMFKSSMRLYREWHYTLFHLVNQISRRLYSVRNNTFTAFQNLWFQSWFPG
jgi:hypothetical protein